MSEPLAVSRTPYRERVLVVEDHAMLAQTLAMALSSDEFEVAVADLAASEDIAAQAGSFRPDLVLLDLDLGRQNGLDVIADLVVLGARVLVLTGCVDEGRLAAAVALGASGWVSKSEPFERLLEACEAAVHGPWLGPRAQPEQLVGTGRAWLQWNRELKTRMGSLTGREREVLTGLQSGMSAKEIATSLVVSLGTVRTHIQAILLKLGVTSQLAAVARANVLAPRAHNRLVAAGAKATATDPETVPRPQPGRR